MSNIPTKSFSRQVLSDPSWPHGLPHARLLCPSPSPGVCPSSCPGNRWCHPTISSSVTLFSFCLQSFPASGSFPVSQLFTLGGKVLELQLQHQSFQRLFRVGFLYDWPVGSPCSPRDSWYFLVNDFRYFIGKGALKGERREKENFKLYKVENCASNPTRPGSLRIYGNCLKCFWKTYYLINFIRKTKDMPYSKLIPSCFAAALKSQVKPPPALFHLASCFE